MSQYEERKIVFADTTQGLETSCVRYFERFCERARAEMASAEGVRELIRAERNAQRIPKIPERARFGAGITSKHGVIDGMRVNERVVELARHWVNTDTRERRKQPGLINRLAAEAGVSRSTLTKVGRRIRDGKL